MANRLYVPPVAAGKTVVAKRAAALSAYNNFTVSGRAQPPTYTNPLSLSDWGYFVEVRARFTLSWTSISHRIQLRLLNIPPPEGSGIKQDLMFVFY